MMPCILLVIMLLLTLTSVGYSNDCPSSDAPCEVFNNESTLKVDILLETVVQKVDERYVSIALDSSLIIHHWRNLDFNSVRLHTLVSALSPAYLRVGGNAADFLVFREASEDTFLRWDKDADNNMDSSSAGCIYMGPFERKNISTFYMSGKDFDSVNKFASRCSVRLLFDLNVLLRDNTSASGYHSPGELESKSKDRWNSSNAQLVLDYSVRRNYSDNLDFELGNEPNSFKHAYNRSVTASQLGHDYKSLRSLLFHPRYSSGFRNSLLVGPAVTQPKKQSLKYLEGFLRVGGQVTNATTVHHYYMDGRIAKADDFLSSDILDSFEVELALLREAMKEAGYASTPLWLGETSSCWGGGAKDLSDRYIAGFMWLDKLGVAARVGISVAVRQSLFEGNYALLDDQLQPNPDYWLTWLFKKLVGRKVFQVKLSLTNKNVRLYAHCTNTKQSGFKDGSVTLYGMNLGTVGVNISLSEDLMKQKKFQYWLLPHGPDGLKSKMVMLTGRVLELASDTKFNDIHPKVVTENSPIYLPATSFGFVVLPNANAVNCRTI